LIRHMTCSSMRQERRVSTIGPGGGDDIHDTGHHASSGPRGE
jgi:hypothetical protein